MRNYSWCSETLIFIFQELFTETLPHLQVFLFVPEGAYFSTIVSFCGCEWKKEQSLELWKLHLQTKSFFFHEAHFATRLRCMQLLVELVHHQNTSCCLGYSQYHWPHVLTKFWRNGYDSSREAYAVHYMDWKMNVTAECVCCKTASIAWVRCF